ncbi:hypothetical protein [Bacillus suaedae]|uniref:Lipoprotein n=1 Tax=Halalkalibacter suaedae TaxID=2822140 RepID=A0A940WXL8_9BACI|nr:hypothetical protein [Bacillus suaedae]MBP3952522.1 hypothetical protein [Bacillus suaedae]
MKKLVVMTFAIVTLITLSACSSGEIDTYWTDKTDNQLQRLDQANIKYEIREGEIWISEEDLFDVVACCS